MNIINETISENKREFALSLLKKSFADLRECDVVKIKRFMRVGLYANITLLSGIKIISEREEILLKREICCPGNEYLKLIDSMMEE